MVSECSQLSRSGPGDGDDVAVREVDDREALLEQALLAHRVAVVQGDAGLETLAGHGARARQQRAPRRRSGRQLHVAHAGWNAHGAHRHSTRLRVADTWLWSSWPTAAMSMTHRRLDSTRPYIRVAALYSFAPGARRTPSVLSWILAGSILP